MNPTETGKLIAKLRKEAGYTQASLASALNITDKAVSKWERGCGQPDTSLLPQISKLLDCDIEVLLSGLSDYKDHEWTGLLVLDEGETSASTMVFDKPLIHYLLSYFLLVGITTVDIKANPKEYEYINSLHLERYGFKISFSQRIRANNMIVFGKSLIFGANLTRTFQSYMAAEDTNIIPTVDDKELPVCFAHYCADVKTVRKIAERKKMPRGMLCLPLNTAEEVKDASGFVGTYQKYHGVKIADLNEIAVKRDIL
ncbi:MAG: helix-turn-helix domain-containing protein [Clostridiales bacterium]|nr:helix-turn-helix domain-containing protein [Candidatus Coliplasma equi]